MTEKAVEIIQRTEPAAAYFPMSRGLCATESQDWGNRFVAGAFPHVPKTQTATRRATLVLFLGVGPVDFKRHTSSRYRSGFAAFRKSAEGFRIEGVLIEAGTKTGRAPEISFLLPNMCQQQRVASSRTELKADWVCLARTSLSRTRCSCSWTQTLMASSACKSGALASKALRLPAFAFHPPPGSSFSVSQVCAHWNRISVAEQCSRGLNAKPATLLRLGL